MTRPFRGEVFDIALNLTPGLEDWGHRPWIVVSNDFYNQRLDTVVLVALTSKDRGEETGCVRVAKAAVSGSPGLSADSMAVCHAPMTVPQSELGSKRGSVTDRMVMVAIDEAIAFALDLAPALE